MDHTGNFILDCLKWLQKWFELLLTQLWDIQGAKDPDLSCFWALNYVGNFIGSNLFEPELDLNRRSSSKFRQLAEPNRRSSSRFSKILWEPDWTELRHHYSWEHSWIGNDGAVITAANPAVIPHDLLSPFLHCFSATREVGCEYVSESNALALKRIACQIYEISFMLVYGFSLTLMQLETLCNSLLLLELCELDSCG